MVGLASGSVGVVAKGGVRISEMVTVQNSFVSFKSGFLSSILGAIGWDD